MPRASASTNINSVQFLNQGAAPGTPAAGLVQMYFKGLAAWLKRPDGSAAPFPIPAPGGRLTATSVTPITTSDVVGATSLYYTPYQHDIAWVYDGTSDWIPIQFTDTAISLTGLTAALPHDVFGYNNSGALAYELLAWTNGTTRATGLTRVNGRLCKTGALSRTLLGTIYTTGTGTTEDSATKRFVWNAYNRVRRNLLKLDTTASWTNTSSTWRQARATAANMVEFVCGDVTYLEALYSAHNEGGIGGFVGIGLDSITAYSGSAEFAYGNSGAGDYRGYLAAGYHYVAMLERGITGNTITFNGNRSGETGANALRGSVEA